VVVLDTIAVLLRRQSGCRPLAGINLQARDAYVFWRGLVRYLKAQTRNRPNVTGVSAAIFLSSEDGPVTSVGEKGEFETALRAEEKKEDFRLATATTMAAGRYATLPLELRMAALCLPMPEKIARAA
jgi:hypothetical protein